MDATRWGEMTGRYGGTKIQFESDLRQGGVLGEEGRVLEDPYLMVEILKYLDWDHLLPLSLVCKTWYHITHNSPTLLHHLEDTRKLAEIGSLPQKMNSCVCAMVVWYGYLAVGLANSDIRLFYQHPSSEAISQVCSFEAPRSGYIGYLETWLPEGEQDVILVSTTSGRTFSLWRMKLNLPPIGGEESAEDALPVVQVESITHQSESSLIHICRHNNRLFVTTGRLVKEVSSKGEMISSFVIKSSIGRMVSWQGYLCLGYSWVPDTNGVGVAVYTTTGEQVKEIPMLAVRYVYVLNDAYLVCSCSASTDIIYLVDRNWNVVAESEQFTGSVFAITQKGNNRFITTDGGRHVKLWAIQEKKKENKQDAFPLSVTCLQTLSQHGYHVYCACWWNGRLYTGDYGGFIHIWK